MDQMWANLGDVLVNVDGLRFQNGHLNELFEWSDLQSVEFESSTVAKSRVGSVVAFGVLGLGARSSMPEAVVEANHQDGRHLAIVFRDIDPTPIRVKLVAALRSVGRELGVPSAPAATAAPAPAPSPVTDFAESLIRLGDMREKGLLTDDEFVEAKRRLLSD